MSNCIPDLVMVFSADFFWAQSKFATDADTDEILIKANVYMCSGAQMVPISWQEMQCPVTFQKEFRKVAKVV